MDSKKIITILALLMITLAACTPVLPGKETEQPTSDVKEDPAPAQKNNTPIAEEIAEQSKEETSEEPQEITEEEKEEEKENLQDLPKKEVVEGETVNFPNLKAVDPDGDPISYTFTSPLTDKGTWKTKEGDAGEYVITITASDGTNTVEQEVLVVVKPKNRPPTIELKEPVETQEGETFTLKPVITDAENNSIKVTYSGWMTSNTKLVSFNDSGLHKVIIKASDGRSETVKEVIITVKHVNRAPELAGIPQKTIKEGEKVTLKPAAKDPDGDAVSVTFGEPLNNDGVWQSAIGDAGEYEITVTATDGVLDAEKVFKLIVEAVNRPPVIELDSPVVVQEGELLELDPLITEPESESFKVTYSGWMTISSKKIGYEDEGSHTVIITARDENGNQAQKSIVIEVEDVNRAPIFGSGSFN